MTTPPAQGYRPALAAVKHRFARLVVPGLRPGQRGHVDLHSSTPATGLRSAPPRLGVLTKSDLDEAQHHRS